MSRRTNQRQGLKLIVFLTLIIFLFTSFSFLMSPQQKHAFADPPPIPGVPTEFLTSVSFTSATISWSAASDATEYDIEVDGATFENGSSMTYINTGLLPESVHSYRVRSKNITGTSDWSIITSITTLPAPLAPVGLGGIADNNSISLTWSVVQGATGYELEADGTIISGITEPLYQVTDLESNTQHTYKVRSVQNSGYGSWSSPVTIYTLLVAPTGIQSESFDASIKMSWNAIAGAESYEVSFDNVVVYSGALTSYLKTGLTADTLHSFKVRGKTSVNNGNWSEITSIRTKPVINVSGIISQDTTWGNTSSVYKITGSITVNQGVVLTISPGVIIKSANTNGITLNGKLDATGSVDNKIVFTTNQDVIYGGAGSADTWKGIIVKSTGEFVGKYVHIRYAGAYYDGGYRSLAIDGKLNFSDSEIYKAQDTAIETLLSSQTIINNVKIISPYGGGIVINCSGSASFDMSNSTIESAAIGINVYKFTGGQFAFNSNTVNKCSSYPMSVNLTTLGAPIFSGIGANTFTNNKNNGYSLNSIFLDGNITTNLTLTESNVGYYFKQLVVPQGIRLEIKPGVTLRAELLANITVNGTLVAQGESEKPIAFCHNNEAEFGGVGVSYEVWYGINISSTGTFIGDYVKIRNAGYSPNYSSINVAGVLELDHSDLRRSGNTGINITSSLNVSIKNTILKNFQVGIKVKTTGTGNLILDGNHIENSQYGCKIDQFGIGTLTVVNNTFTMNDYYPMLIDLGGLNASVLVGIGDNTFIQNLKYDGADYNAIVIFGTPKINLEIPQGKFIVDNTDITISAGKTLTINAGAILRFVSTTNRIIIDGVVRAMGTKDNPAVFTQLKDPEYSGNNNTVPSWWGGIKINSTGEFIGDFVRVRHAFNSCLGSVNSLIDDQGKLTITNSELFHGWDSGIFVNSSYQPVIKMNSFKDNSSYAVYNSRSSTMTIDATSNYWGSPKGPGIVGNRVSAGVLYTPWLGEELKQMIHFGKPGVYDPTGSYSKQYTDLTLVTPGFETLEIKRTYNSGDTKIGKTYGKGWSFNFECSIENYTGFSPIKVVRIPNGGVQTFTILADGTFKAIDSRSKLETKQDGSFLLTTQDQFKYTFSSKGFLVRQSDRNGNTIDITVDFNGKIGKITDQADRNIIFLYQDDRLKTITDWAGRIVSYEYTNEMLTKTIDPMGNSSYYEYNSDKLISSIKDNELNILEEISFIHDPGIDEHKVYQLKDTFGNTITKTYDNTNKKTTTTDTNARITTVWYDDDLYITSQKDPEGRTTVIEFFKDGLGANKLGEEKSKTDRNGNKVQYERDAVGNVTKEINPDGSYKFFVYDVKNNLISKRDEDGKMIFYIYDSENKNMWKEAKPINGNDIWTPGCDESAFSITEYSYYSTTESQSHGYLGNSLLKSITDANGDTTTYTYYSNGDTKTTSDPETGLNTTYEYNSKGLVTAEISQSGNRTEKHYDANGNIEKEVLQGGETTRKLYDTSGNLIRDIQPNLYDSLKDNLAGHSYSGTEGSVLEYYVNGQLKKSTDARLFSTQFTYDLYGNLLTETRANGSIYLFEYDMMNRPIRKLFKTDGLSNSTILEEYTYYIQADCKTKKFVTKYLGDGETSITTFVYDYAEKLLEQQNPDGTTVSVQYNLNGTEKTSIDVLENTTYYNYDGLNRLTEKWVPAVKVDAITSYIYQKFSYDKTDKIISEKTGKNRVPYPVADTTFFTKDSTYYKNGLLKSVSDDEGRLTSYWYDNDGNVSKEVVKKDATSSKVTEYVNNYFGKIAEMKIHMRTGDVTGNLITDDSDITLNTAYSYDKNGNLLTTVTPTEIVTTNSYDEMNNLASMMQDGLDESSLPSTIRTEMTYNWEGKLLTKKDPEENITTNRYTAEGYVKETETADGGVTAYFYDLAGRKTSVVSPKNYDSSKELTQMSRSAFTYDLMDRPILSLEIYWESENNSWITQVISAKKYDVEGNLVKSLDALGFEAGVGSSVAEKIDSGYGTEYAYDLAGNQISILDAVSKDRSLLYTEKYNYDSIGRKTQMTNASGVITKWSLDNLGNVLTKQVQKDTSSSENLVESYEYDLTGNKTKATDGNGNSTLYEYNNFDKERSVSTAGDSTIDTDTVVSQYDKEGQITYSKGSMNGQNEFTYDNQGRMLSKTRKKQDGENALTQSYRYDLNGNLRFSTNENGITEESQYNGMNQLIQTKILVNGINHSTEYYYDLNGNQTAVKDWRGNTTTQVYDPLNRLIQKINPMGTVIQKLEYSRNNTQVKSYDALDKLTQYVYDKNGRLLTTIDPLLHETTSTYDNAGNVTVKTDGKGNPTTYGFDEFNQLITVTNGKSEVTSYTYDLKGNQLSMTDGKGNTSFFEYNKRNKLKRRIDAGGRTGNEGNYTYDASKIETYTYNADQFLSTSGDRNGELSEFTYDIHGRLLMKKVGATEIGYAYDSMGNQLTMTDSTGTTIRTYDELNRVVSKQVPEMGLVTYTYDITAGMPAGYVGESSLDPKGNSSTKVFDKELRLKEVRVGSEVTAYTYNANGSKTEVLYPDGENETYSYNEEGLLIALVNKKSSGTVIDSYSYTYDAANNQISKTDSKGITSYTYDSLNRLLSVAEPTGKETTYSHDGAGNRLSSTEVAGGNSLVTNYGYNGQNRLIGIEKKNNGTLVSGETITDDHNGNLTENSKVPYVDGLTQPAEVTTMTYDKMNQMTSVVVAGVSTAYSYNGEGLRVTKASGAQAVHYLYEGDHVVLEVDGQGAQIARNIYGNNLLSRNVSAMTLYYMYNGHGDVTALIDAAGTKKASYYYDAFGNVMEQTGTVDNNITYAGYQYDKESGLYYLNARMYDPVTARFMQEDTYRGQMSDPLSLNLYTYCHNEPLMYSDPTGHIRVDGQEGNDKPGIKTAYLRAKIKAKAAFNTARKSGVVTSAKLAQKKSIKTQRKARVKFVKKFAIPILKKEVKKGLERNLDEAQLGFDVAGIIPGVGEPFDVANGAIYALRGDYVNAALSEAAAIPIAGWAATSGKFINKGMKAIDKAEDAGRILKKVNESGSDLSKADILRQNKIAGTAAEKLAAQQLIDDGYKIVGSQVSARTAEGRRIIDHLVLDPAGNMMAIEVKSGNAVRSKSQSIKDMLIETEGGILTGKNASELIGQFIQIPTKEMRMPR